ADVIAFLDSLQARGAPYVFGSIGKTVEGREIPYVIASRPLVRTPAQALRSGKPIVYVQANIHAGEVEGKEAVQALLRDLAFAKRPNLLDSIILIAVPIYNADGNERVGPQDRQRTEQNGPELVGQRPNAQGLDLNRDYVKAEAPETRASLAMFNTWDPDVFVDLHTTDGSFHGYALTYSPSLNPAAPLGDYTRALLAALRTRVRQRDGYETFDYGNFNDAFENEVSTDTVHAGWYTYDHRPRFGTNYYGLRNRVSILSEAFSHDPFERRVKVTYAFTKELLSLVAERAAELTRHTRTRAAAKGTERSEAIPLRSALPSTASSQPVAFEILARTGDSSRTQPGVPRGLRRTGEIRTRMMPVFDQFVPTLSRSLPLEYVLSTDSTVIAVLRLHGIHVDTADAEAATLEAFAVDSLVRSPRAFQGHHELRVWGHWAVSLVPRSKLLIVRTSQPLGRLAAYLLDPESDDSFFTWNLFDATLSRQRLFPVLRSAKP
ncbi:MAG: M14 family metallopeptidase, partial [Gemmatimonadota bacterium]|nr:M14 family metallopeptidase [Gemmatimonadota bacterium]